MSEDFDEPLFVDWEFREEDFAGVDALIEHLKSLPRATVYWKNTQRVQQMRFSYAMLNRILRETSSDASIKCGQDEFDASVGFVTVEGADISITDMEGFARAVEFANNSEVIPLKANKVRMSLMFYGLANPTSLKL